MKLDFYLKALTDRKLMEWNEWEVVRLVQSMNSDSLLSAMVRRLYGEELYKKVSQINQERVASFKKTIDLRFWNSSKTVKKAEQLLAESSAIVDEERTKIILDASKKKPNQRDIKRTLNTNNAYYLRKICEYLVEISLRTGISKSDLKELTDYLNLLRREYSKNPDSVKILVEVIDYINRESIDASDKEKKIFKVLEALRASARNHKVLDLTPGYPPSYGLKERLLNTLTLFMPKDPIVEDHLLSLVEDKDGKVKISPLLQHMAMYLAHSDHDNLTSIPREKVAHVDASIDNLMQACSTEVTNRIIGNQLLDKLSKVGMTELPDDLSEKKEIMEARLGRIYEELENSHEIAAEYVALGQKISIINEIIEDKRKIFQSYIDQFQGQAVNNQDPKWAQFLNDFQGSIRFSDGDFIIDRNYERTLLEQLTSHSESEISLHPQHLRLLATRLSGKYAEDFSSLAQDLSRIKTPPDPILTKSDCIEKLNKLKLTIQGEYLEKIQKGEYVECFYPSGEILQMIAERYRTLDLHFVNKTPICDQETLLQVVRNNLNKPTDKYLREQLACMCAKFGYIDVLDELLKSEPKISLDKIVEKSSTPKKGTGRKLMHLAVAHNHKNIVEYLRNKHTASVSVRDRNGDTPLFYAAASGNLTMIQDLIAMGASVAEKDNQGLRALNIAAANGHLDVVKHLVQNGAKIHPKKNQSALSSALANRRTDVALYLISQSKYGSYNVSELQEAIKLGDPYVIAKLLLLSHPRQISLLKIDSQFLIDDFLTSRGVDGLIIAQALLKWGFLYQHLKNSDIFQNLLSQSLTYGYSDVTYFIICTDLFDRLDRRSQLFKDSIKYAFKIEAFDFISKKVDQDFLAQLETEELYDLFVNRGNELTKNFLMLTMNFKQQKALLEYCIQYKNTGAASYMLEQMPIMRLEVLTILIEHEQKSLLEKALNIPLEEIIRTEENKALLSELAIKCSDKSIQPTLEKVLERLPQKKHEKSVFFSFLSPKTPLTAPKKEGGGLSHPKKEGPNI